MLSEYDQNENKSHEKRKESILSSVREISDRPEISKLMSDSLSYYLFHRYGLFNPYNKIIAGFSSESVYRGFKICEVDENDGVLDRIIRKLDRMKGHSFSIRDSFYGVMLLDNCHGFLCLEKLKEEWIEYTEVRELFLSNSRKDRVILRNLVIDEMADVTCCILKLLSYSSTFHKIETLLRKNSKIFRELDNCFSFDEVVGQFLDIYCEYHKRQPLSILNDYLASMYRELNFLDITLDLDTILLRAYIKRRERYQFSKRRIEGIKITTDKGRG